jgi:RNA polymerase sigma factor (sigma-70 family)
VPPPDPPSLRYREIRAARRKAEEVALRQWLVGALGRLTLRERAVIIMRYLFDLPEATVARDLGITLGTVKSTSSRALAKLRVAADTQEWAVTEP